MIDIKFNRFKHLHKYLDQQKIDQLEYLKEVILFRCYVYKDWSLFIDESEWDGCDCYYTDYINGCPIGFDVILPKYLQRIQNHDRIAMILFIETLCENKNKKKIKPKKNKTK